MLALQSLQHQRCSAIELETHCEPLLLGPAFAIDTVKGRSCLKLRLNSSSNSPPQMLWPPVPSPAGVQTATQLPGPQALPFTPAMLR